MPLRQPQRKMVRRPSSHGTPIGIIGAHFPELFNPIFSGPCRILESVVFGNRRMKGSQCPLHACDLLLVARLETMTEAGIESLQTYTPAFDVSGAMALARRLDGIRIRSRQIHGAVLSFLCCAVRVGCVSMHLEGRARSSVTLEVTGPASRRSWFELNEAMPCR